MADKFEQFLTACIMTPVGTDSYDVTDPSCTWGIPVNFIGASGAGKSSRVNKCVSLAGLPCWTIYTATKSPEHFSGVFVPTPDGEVATVCGLPQVKAALDHRGGVIFLDEISCAPEAVQAALLSFVNERQVGEYALPARTRIVLAMNPADVAANGQDLATPMANRMAHFPYENPSNAQWCDWLLKRYVPEVLNVTEGEAKVKAGWNYHYSQVAGLAEEFTIANNGQYEIKKLDDLGRIEKDDDGKDKIVKVNKLHNQPPPDDIRSSGPWPSHRTWFWTVCGISTVRCLGLDPKLEIDMVECLVGKGLATEWATFAAKMDLPRPEEVLSGKWKMPRRIDIVRTVLNSTSTYITEKKDRREQCNDAVPLWDIINKAIKAGYGDIVVKPISQLLRAGLDPDCEDQAVKKAAEIVCDQMNDTGMTDHIHPS